MEKTSFETLFASITQIKKEQKYWMVRTMGGRFYGEFITSDYIAVGFNKISLQDLISLPASDDEAKKSLKDIFEQEYPENRNIGYSVSQLLRFSREIKPGDVVIIPSSGAVHIAIGIVTDEMYEEEPTFEFEDRCDFKKRIPVSWKFRGRRCLLPPSFQLMFNSRHILSDVSGYAPYIDSIIHDYYEKDETINLVLRIRTKDDVSVDDFCDIKAISTLVNGFCKLHNLPDTEVPIIMKIQMESPGWLRLSTKSRFKGFLWGVFLSFFVGGGLRFSPDEGLEVYSKGILESISDFLDRQADRELVRAATRALDSTKIQNPEDLKPVMDLLKVKNEKRNKY